MKRRASSLELSADAGFPLYQQVRAILLNQIDSGEFHPGDRLPTEEELARQFGTSRITIRQALDTLAAEDLLIRKPRAGTYLKQAPTRTRIDDERRFVGIADIVATLPRRGGHVLRHGITRPPAIVGRTLGIPPGSETPFFVKILDDKAGPRAAVKRYVTTAFAAALTKAVRDAADFDAALACEIGRPLILGHGWLEAIQAEPHLVLILRVPLGSALLSAWWVHELDGKPVALTQFLNAGRNVAAAF